MTDRRQGAGAPPAPPGVVSPSEIRRAAREALGYRELRPGQAEAIRAVLSGHDTLALLPTGGGKSAIYQLAAAERPGPTVVISPLIALQRDQLEALDEHDRLGAAAALNSTLTGERREELLDAFAAGRLEFILLAPEQLAEPAVLDRLAAGRPSLFVVDEVHCISEWGHDFRPEYRRLGSVAEALGRPPILGLTATASPAVREEVIEWLRLRDPVIVARGFDRPNIFLAVDTFADAAAKRRAVVDWVRGREGSGIVYTATRRAAVEVADELAAGGIAAAAYHAGLAARRRSEIQDAFMTDDVRVIVATVAFGMGVDKPDVRFVAHHDVSDGLEAYHQEMGRGGRDGEPAEARLFYRADDLGLRRFQGAPAVIDEDAVRAVLRVLARRPPEPVKELARLARLSVRRTEAIVERLEVLGAVRVEPDDRVVRIGEQLDAGELSVDVVTAQERRRRRERSRVDLLRGYAETNGCRRRFLLNDLGEEYEPPCGACDNCLAAAAAGQPVPADDAHAGGPFAMNDRVRHVGYGPGIVTRVEDGRIVVAFEDAGYRMLDVEECLRRGLLVREP